MSWPDDADIVSCDHCGTDVVLDHDPPCPHGYAACPGCGWEAVCRECKEQSERDMSASGVYDPKADPLYDHTAPAYVPPALHHLAGGVWVETDPAEEQR